MVAVCCRRGRRRIQCVRRRKSNRKAVLEGRLDLDSVYASYQWNSWFQGALDRCYLSVVGPSIFVSVPSGCNRCLSRLWHYWTRCQSGAAPSPTHWLGRSADVVILIDSKQLPEVQCKRDHQFPRTECRKRSWQADRRTKQRTLATGVRTRSGSSASPAPAFYVMAWHGLPLPRRSRGNPAPAQVPADWVRLGFWRYAGAGWFASKSSLAFSLPVLITNPVGRQRRIISEGAESGFRRSLLLSPSRAHRAYG